MGIIAQDGKGWRAMFLTGEIAQLRTAIAQPWG